MRTLCRPISPQPDRPCSQDRAVVTRGHSLVAFYPGCPADWVSLSSGRTPSDTQADGVEACFSPGGLSMLASLRQNRGEYSAQGNSGLAAVRNPRKQSCQSVWW